MSLETLRTVTLGVAAVGQTLFALAYLTFPWWRTFLGRALFGKAAMLTLLIDFAFTGRMIGFGKNDGIFVVLYTLLALGTWAEFLAFVGTMLKSRRKDWGQETDTQYETRKARDVTP